MEIPKDRENPQDCDNSFFHKTDLKKMQMGGVSAQEGQ